MSRRTIVMIGMVVGSAVGGYLPTLFGVDFFSFPSILFNAIGGIVGIWISFQLTQDF